jgi:hypothetical protein
MLSVAQGSLVIVDGKDVFWRGNKVEEVEAIIVHSFDNSIMVKLDVRGADPVVVSEMIAGGVKVKVL